MNALQCVPKSDRMTLASAAHIFSVLFFWFLLPLCVCIHGCEHANNITHYKVHTFILISHISLNSCRCSFYRASEICSQPITPFDLNMNKKFKITSQKKWAMQQNQSCFQQHRLLTMGKRSPEWLNQFIKALGVLWCGMDYSQRLNFWWSIKTTNVALMFYVVFYWKMKLFFLVEFVDFLAIFIAYLHKHDNICMRSEIWMKNTKYKPVRTLN